MVRLVAIVALALALAGCDMINSTKDAFKTAQATEEDLEASTGQKPSVGFNWTNGRLIQVTVTYPRLVEGKPIPELVEAVRAAVHKEFKQEPEKIVLGFVVRKPADRAVRLERAAPPARQKHDFGHLRRHGGDDNEASAGLKLAGAALPVAFSGTALHAEGATADAQKAAAKAPVADEFVTRVFAAPVSLDKTTYACFTRSYDPNILRSIRSRRSAP